MLRAARVLRATEMFIEGTHSEEKRWKHTGIWHGQTICCVCRLHGMGMAWNICVYVSACHRVPVFLCAIYVPEYRRTGMFGCSLTQEYRCEMCDCTFQRQDFKTIDALRSLLIIIDLV